MFRNLEKLGSLDSETRFYNSGMAQGRLLDQLGVEWKDKIMEKSIFFDDLLTDAVE